MSKGNRVNKFGWDKGLDYPETKHKLEKMIKELSTSDNSRGVINLFYACCALCQLENGLRSQEAIEAMLNFLENLSLEEVEVRVRKKKEPVTREVFLPKTITRKILEKLRKRVEIQQIKERFEKDPWRASKSYQNWCRRRLGANSHALRYTFISYHSRRGVSAQILASLTRHSRLDFILAYTSKIQARELLKNWVRGDGK